MTLHVGAYRVGADSWNHSKIVSIDGEKVFTGGHNLWTRHYLQEAPVHDVSVVLDSTIAVDAIAISMFSGITHVKTTGVDPRPIGQCTPGGSRIVQMRMLLRLPTTIKVFQSSRLDALGVWEKPCG